MGLGAEGGNPGKATKARRRILGVAAKLYVRQGAFNASLQTRFPQTRTAAVELGAGCGNPGKGDKDKEAHLQASPRNRTRVCHRHV